MFLPFWVCAHFTLCWRERWPLFHYLKLGLGAVLAFVGAKMLLVHTAWRTDTLSALLVVATVIAASFLASLLCRRREHRNKVAVLSINRRIYLEVAGTPELAKKFRPRTTRHATLSALVVRPALRLRLVWEVPPLSERRRGDLRRALRVCRVR